MDVVDILGALAVAALAAIPLTLTLWALLDAARRPQWAWALTGRRQVLWMAGITFGAITVVGGLLIAAWYLTKVRPEVAAAEDGDI